MVCGLEICLAIALGIMQEFYRGSTTDQFIRIAELFYMWFTKQQLKMGLFWTLGKLALSLPVILLLFLLLLFLYC